MCVCGSFGRRTHQGLVQGVHVAERRHGQVQQQGAEGRDGDDELHPAARGRDERFVHGEDVEGAGVVVLFGVVVLGGGGVVHE